MARASCASRWAGWRSVFRLIWPELDSHELVRWTGHRRPLGWFFPPVEPRLHFLAMSASSIKR
jgi:hypothetical protein